MPASYHERSLAPCCRAAVHKASSAAFSKPTVAVDAKPSSTVASNLTCKTHGKHSSSAAGLATADADGKPAAAVKLSGTRS